VSPTKVEDQFKTLGGSYIADGTTGTTGGVEPVAPVVNKVCPPGQIFSEEFQMCVINHNASRDNNDDDNFTPPEPEIWGDGVNWSTPEGITDYVTSVLTPMDPMLSKGLQVTGLIAGGPIGLAIGSAPILDAINDLSNARATSLIARAMGDDKTADAIDAQISTYVEKAPAMATGKLGSWFSSGTGRAGSLARRLGFKSLEDAKKQREAFASAVRLSSPKEDYDPITVNTQMSKVESGYEKALKEGKDDDGGYTITVPSGTGTRQNKDKSTTLKVTKKQADIISKSAAKIDEEDADTFEDLNKGGLIKKRKNKKK